MSRENWEGNGRPDEGLRPHMFGGKENPLRGARGDLSEGTGWLGPQRR